MGYVVGLGLQNPELTIGHSVAEILNVEVREIYNFGNSFLFYFVHFCQSPVTDMAANYICIKQKTNVYGKRR